MTYASLENISDLAASRWEQAAQDPRTAQLLGSLIRHLHAFAAENDLTMPEWFEATEWLARAGQISNDKRKEFILLSDVLGLSMLLELMHDSKPDAATQSTLLGPFYIPHSPEIGYGEPLPGVTDAVGIPLIVTGIVRSLDGTPVAGATIDVWQNDPDGIYEAQMPHCSDPYYRAITRSRDDGSYMFRAVVPVDYAIPTDGPVGQLLALTTISPVRPAHIHFKVEADGYPPLITHVFDRTSVSLGTDPVFGTREGLLVDLIEHPAGELPNGETTDQPWRVLNLDFALA